jgi:chromosome segregation ATPase
MDELIGLYEHMTFKLTLASKEFNKLDAFSRTVLIGSFVLSVGMAYFFFLFKQPPPPQMKRNNSSRKVKVLSNSPTLKQKKKKKRNSIDNDDKDDELPAKDDDKLSVSSGSGSIHMRKSVSFNESITEIPGEEDKAVFVEETLSPSTSSNSSSESIILSPQLESDDKARLKLIKDLDLDTIKRALLLLKKAHHDDDSDEWKTVTKKGEVSIQELTAKIDEYNRRNDELVLSNNEIKAAFDKLTFQNQAIEKTLLVNQDTIKLLEVENVSLKESNKNLLLKLNDDEKVNQLKELRASCELFCLEKDQKSLQLEKTEKRFKELEDEFVALKDNVASTEEKIEILTAGNAQLQKDRDEAIAERDLAVKEKSDLKNKLQATQKVSSELEKIQSAHTSLTQELEKTLEQVTLFEAEKVKLAEEIAGLKKNESLLNQEIQSLQELNRAKTMEFNEIEELKTTKESELKSKIDDLHEELSRLQGYQTKVEELRAEIDELSSVKEKLSKVCHESSLQLESKSKEATELKSEVELLKDEKNTLVSKLEHEMEKLKAELESAKKAAVEKLKNEVEKADAEALKEPNKENDKADAESSTQEEQM